jgi:hypothetical protein
MRIQATDRPFTRAGIDLVVKQYRAKQPKLFSRYVRTIENRDQSFFRVAQEGDMGPAGVVNEATGIPYTDFSQGFYRDFYAWKRGLGFAVSTERLETDLYGIMDTRARKMAQSMQWAIEIDMANFFNLATATDLVGPDGQPLASASHPLDSGVGTNIIPGNPPLSYTALATAWAMFMSEPTQAGNYGMRTGPFALVIGVNGPVDTAMRLWKTRDRMPGGDQNDVPWANVATISDVIIVPWITSPTAWALVDIGPDNPMAMIERRGYRSNEQYDQEHDVWKFAVTQIWGKALTDWRGFLYSAGA